MLIWPTRTTRERLDYGHDWGPLLEAGETITAEFAEATRDLDVGDTYRTGTVQTVWLADGARGVDQVRLWIITSAGRTWEQVFQITTAI